MDSISPRNLWDEDCCDSKTAVWYKQAKTFLGVCYLLRTSTQLIYPISTPLSTFPIQLSLENYMIP